MCNICKTDEQLGLYDWDVDELTNYLSELGYGDYELIDVTEDYVIVHFDGNRKCKIYADGNITELN